LASQASEKPGKVVIRCIFVGEIRCWSLAKKQKKRENSEKKTPVKRLESRLRSHKKKISCALSCRRMKLVEIGGWTEIEKGE
jgi:hypothetical protein